MKSTASSFRARQRRRRGETAAPAVNSQLGLVMDVEESSMRINRESESLSPSRLQSTVYRALRAPLLSGVQFGHGRLLRNGLLAIHSAESGC